MVFLFYFFSLVAQVEHYDSDAFISEALKLMEEEKYPEARDVMAKVHPSDEEYYDNFQIEIANTYVAEEKIEEAIAVFKRLYDDGHFEKNPALYVNYASILSDAERYEEAEVIYKEAEANYPNYSQLIFNMGISYYSSGDIQKGIDYTKRAIVINPGYAKAHYFLGVLALESGQIAEGALALIGYLACDPNDNLAINAITQLNKKMAQNYIDEKDHVYSVSGDDFSKLTLILRNQLPLNEKYKLECDIDDIYTRHVQAVAEYAATHTVKDGFFEKQYIPFLADIYKKGHIENFTYYTLSGVENFEDNLKKKEKDILKFYEDYFVTDYWFFFGNRKMQHLGKESEVIIHCEDNVPSMISIYEGKMRNGWTTFVDEYGRITGKVNLVKDMPEGIVTHYDEKGKKTEEINFENGEKNGNQITYYDTGEKSSEWVNVNGVADGPFTTYYKDGSIYCQSNFKNDEYHGKSICYYVSGQPEFEVNYNMGKFDGKRITYFENGNISSSEEYINGILNGKSEYYATDGRKLSSVLFEDDVVTENYSIHDKEGKITYDYVVDGDNTIATEYINGKISQVTFSKKNKLVGTDSYIDGIKYVSQKFDGEKLKECIQFTKGKEKGEKLNLSNHKLYYINGNLVSHRKFKDGKIDGQCIYYYLNGNVRSEFNYKEGKEDGITKLYDKKGNLTNEYNIKEDVLNGLSKEYKDGVLVYTFNYKDGKLNGPLTAYHPNGTVGSIGFYLDDSPHGKYEYYNSNGVLINVDEYQSGEMTSSKYIERDGTVGSIIDYSKQSGSATRQVNYSPVKYEMNILNGKFHGQYYGIDERGDSIYVTNFINGKRDGRTIYFSGAGYPSFEGNLVNGYQHGVYNYYDDLGVLRVSSEFQNDMEDGIEKIYSYNGSVIEEFNNASDIIQGERKIFNSTGMLLLTLYYVDDVIMKYKNFASDEWVDIGKDKKQLNVYYDNGSIALEFAIVKGYIDEKLAIYDDNGNQVYEKNYKDGMVHGSTKSFYPNGKLYKQIEYKMGHMNGEVQYYDEHENIRLKYTNVMDQKDGPYEVYENGKLVFTKIYEADELIEIK